MIKMFRRGSGTDSGVAYKTMHNGKPIQLYLKSQPIRTWHIEREQDGEQIVEKYQKLLHVEQKYPVFWGLSYFIGGCTVDDQKALEQEQKAQERA